MANVILLRSPSSGAEDRYESALTEAGYHTISIPVLETVLTNVGTLKDIVGAGPAADNLNGVILTSARSCEAWKIAVGQLVGVSAAQEGNWSLVPFYVVGQGTASALAEVGQKYGQTEFTPMIIRGDSSGTAEHLAQYIQEHGGNTSNQKLLYLTGDKNSDAVPSILGEAGIELQSLKVYETHGSRTFERDLMGALKPASTAFKRWWIVHFAPSAAELVYPILNNHFNSDRFMSHMETNSTLRVAAIGPVTSSFLQDKLQIHVDVVAAKPTPRDLVAAIVAYDRDSGL